MGKASWVLRYRFGGREKEKMLRRNPDLSPKDARELARKDRAQLGFFSGDQAIVLGVKVRKLLLDGRWVRHAQRHNRLGAADRDDLRQIGVRHLPNLPGLPGLRCLSAASTVSWPRRCRLASGKTMFLRRCADGGADKPQIFVSSIEKQPGLASLPLANKRGSEEPLACT